MSLLSVVVPVYNREDCIAACIESVIPQLSEKYELIIVDDGSGDGTREIVNRYRDTPRLRIVSYPHNKGVNYARNRGVETASGEFILFLDSDDTLEPSALRTITSVIEKNSGYKHYLFLVDDFAGVRSREEKIVTYLDWLSESVSGDFAHVVSRETLLAYPFDESFRLYELLVWLKIFKTNERMLYVPSIVMYRDRSRPDSLSLEHLLQSKRSMQQDYNFTLKFTEYYTEDMLANGLDSLLGRYLQKAILLGVALNRIQDNKTLLQLFRKINPGRARALRVLNCSLFSLLLYLSIKYFSKLKRINA